MMYYNKTTRELSSTPPWGNQYIADELKSEIYVDWQTVSDDFIPPVPEPTKEEKIVALDAEYQPQFKELAEALGMANLNGDATATADIKADYTKLKAEYQTKLEAINSAY